MLPIVPRFTVLAAAVLFVTVGEFALLVVVVGAVAGAAAVGRAPLVPRRYAMSSAFCALLLGKLPAAKTVFPATATGALVLAESIVCQISFPVLALNAYNVPLNVVVNKTSLASVAAPYGEDGSLSSHS